MGNKDHWVCYSKEAIINGTEIASKNSAYLGNKTWGGNNICAGKSPRRYFARCWYE